jgi:hypothetical protein
MFALKVLNGPGPDFLGFSGATGRQGNQGKSVGDSQVIVMPLALVLVT